VDGESQEETNM